MELKSILVPTDFSENSTQAFKFAAQLAKLNSSILHVLHVVKPISSSKDYFHDFDIERYQQSLILGAEEKLRRFIANNSCCGLNVVEKLLVGKPHEQIIQYSKENGLDLIVIGTHGWTSLSTILMGNVCNKVVQFSETPVICMKGNNMILQKEAQNRNTTYAENWVG